MKIDADIAEVVVRLQTPAVGYRNFRTQPAAVFPAAGEVAAECTRDGDQGADGDGTAGKPGPIDHQGANDGPSTLPGVDTEHRAGHSRRVGRSGLDLAHQPSVFACGNPRPPQQDPAIRRSHG